MEPKRDLAIILRSVPYEERHRVVTALTEKHGKVSALARNSIQSRRFGGTLDPFVASLWSFKERPGGMMLSLESAEIRRSFEGIRHDFRRLSVASVLTELMLKIAPEGEASSELFKLHSNALAWVDEITSADWNARVELALLGAYFSKALQWSGNQPSLMECMHCGRSIEDVEQDRSLRGSLSEGGWTCCGSLSQDERGAGAFKSRYLSVTPTAIRDWLDWMNVPIKNVLEVTRSSEAELADLFELISGFAAFHLPGLDRVSGQGTAGPEPIRSLKFLGVRSCLSS